LYAGDSRGRTRLTALQEIRTSLGSAVHVSIEIRTGWGPGWRGARYGAYWDTGEDFVKKYTGRVVASLTAASGEHMRCRFQLVHPSSGMAGGGSGECQLPNGKTIDANFPAQ